MIASSIAIPPFSYHGHLTIAIIPDVVICSVFSIGEWPCTPSVPDGRVDDSCPIVPSWDLRFEDISMELDVDGPIWDIVFHQSIGCYSYCTFPFDRVVRSVSMLGAARGILSKYQVCLGLPKKTRQAALKMDTHETIR